MISGTQSNLNTVSPLTLESVVDSDVIEAMQVNHISAKEACYLIEEHRHNPLFTILDIRTAEEYQSGHIPGAICIDYYSPEFEYDLDCLDRSASYLIYCRSGARTSDSLALFEELGFVEVHHMIYGIVQWQMEGMPLIHSTSKAVEKSFGDKLEL